MNTYTHGTYPDIMQLWIAHLEPGSYVEEADIPGATARIHVKLGYTYLGHLQPSTKITSF